MQLERMPAERGSLCTVRSLKSRERKEKQAVHAVSTVVAEAQHAQAWRSLLLLLYYKWLLGGALLHAQA